MIKIDRDNLDVIAEEYYSHLHSWLFDKGKFDLIKESVKTNIDKDVLKRYFDFLCYKMEKSLNDKSFVLASPQTIKKWLPINKTKGKARVKVKAKELFASLMEKLYNAFFQFKIDKEEQTVGYWLVDRLKIRVCPYCNRNYTFTVAKTKSPKVRAQFDHFFPKKKFPMFALCFYNLIPACPICNKLKGEQIISFNPYQEGFPFNQKFVLSDGINDLSWVHPASKLKISLINSDDNLNNKQLLLEQLYQQHEDIAKDIILKAQAYNDDYYDGIISSFQGAGYSKDYINTLIWGTYINDVQFGERPFSKFTKDILDQIGII